MEPENSREKQGKWKKGCSGNPAGKPRGTRHKITLLAEGLVSDRAEEILAATIQRGLDGDTGCLRVLVDRILPPLRERPVKIDLSTIRSISDLPNAMTTIVAACAIGDLLPSEASGLASLLESMSKTLAVSDLEQRILALEAKMGVR